MEYTAKLEIARTKRIPKLISAMGRGRGIGAHKVRASVKANIGVRRNKAGEDVEGRTGSFIKSFSPSAIG